MKSTNFPHVKPNPYNSSKLGYCGELGEGANAKIRFLQTVIGQEELDDITLISNIPGSETWEVKDLFQRDVDDDRVEKQIMPYYKDKTKVKFFNPLTLIVLPMDETGNEVIKKIDYIEPKMEKVDDFEALIYEKPTYYKFTIFQNDEAYGKLEWNRHKCFLVAIDGQHRLSALQRWKAEPGSNFSDWKIPVVILNIYKVSNSKPTANLLEIVRKTFVYINTKAERINKAREILLNDESVNAICTQELIQYSHKNDNKDLRARDNLMVPLIFYDWRGEVVNNVRQYGPAAVKTIEEIYSWFEEYILGEDGNGKQENQLFLTDLIPPLEGYGPNKSLSHEDALRIRVQFQDIVMPGFLYFLQNFEPYKGYIAECRKIEEEAIERSDNAKHAFVRLRFGTDNAPKDQFDMVNREYENLVETFENLKTKFPEILEREIGMRGIVYAFGRCKFVLESINKKSKSWLEYSKIFTEAINEIYNEKWFLSYNDLEAKKRKMLTHIVFDDSGSIINYKIEYAKEALGALMLIFVFHKFLAAKKIKENNLIELWADQSNILWKTIERGFRKYHKSQLKETFKGTIDEFNKEVKKLSEKDATKRIKEISNYLGLN